VLVSSGIVTSSSATMGASARIAVPLMDFGFRRPAQAAMGILYAGGLGTLEVVSQGKRMRRDGRTAMISIGSTFLAGKKP